MLVILVVAVIGGFGLYVMTPMERQRLKQAALTAIWRARDEIVDRRSRPDAFRDALRTRTRHALVTPALIVVNATVFLCMIFGRGAIGDPSTLIAWGGNFGPQTTNGEWPRLLTAMFVHAGLLHLLINMVALAQAGLLVERLVGRLAMAGVYLAAGTLASLLSLNAHPMDVSVGASAAIFSVYGLLLASSVWTMWNWFQPARDELLESGERSTRPALTIPFTAIVPLAPSAVVFVLYSVLDGDAGADLAGLAAGFVSGIALTRHVSVRKPAALHVAAATLATIVLAGISFSLMSRVTDVRPEIAQVVALEDRTAGAYAKAVAQFRKGRLSAEALAQQIDKTIMPELRAVRARLTALTGVPEEHQPLVSSAEEYLRLRDESWRLRSEGLHKSNMPALREAELPERAALIALQRISPDGGK